MVFISVIIYIVLMAAYYYVDWYVAGNVFFKSKDHEVSFFQALKLWHNFRWPSADILSRFVSSQS